MSARGDEEAARFFQALGDPTRLALVRELRTGPRNVGELVTLLGCPQPKVSRHLKVLKDAGLVRDQRDGRNVAYSLATSRAWPAPARAWFAALESGLPLRGEARPAPAEPMEPAEPAKPTPRPRRRDLEAHLL